MRKIKVQVQRYDDGRVNKLSIFYPKLSTFRMLYNSDKQITGLEISGQHLGISLGDIIAICSWATQDVFKTPVILASGLAYTPLFVVNGGFEENFLGWSTSGANVVINTVVFYEGAQSCQFLGLGSYILQELPKAMSMAQVRHVSCRLRTDDLTNGLTATLEDESGRQILTELDCSALNTWELKELNIDRTMMLKKIKFVAWDAAVAMFLDDVTFWF